MSDAGQGNDRLARQLRFLLEADRLKSVERSCLLADGSRVETSAEHSWHLALMAIVLHEHFSESIDLGRALALIAVHDLAEVYAGDTVIYDASAVATQVEREDAAARRLFDALRDDQRLMLVALRSEFEAGETPEARFARAVDSFQPTWQHWGDHANPPMENLSASSVLARKRQFVGPVDALWEELTGIVEAATRRGLLTP
jgi:putative hydrolase of HD superfamily